MHASAELVRSPLARTKTPAADFVSASEHWQSVAAGLGSSEITCAAYYCQLSSPAPCR